MTNEEHITLLHHCYGQLGLAIYRTMDDEWPKDAEKLRGRINHAIKDLEAMAVAPAEPAPVEVPDDIEITLRNMVLELGEIQNYTRYQKNHIAQLQIECPFDCEYCRE